MTPLRQKMINEMEVRGFAPRTIQSYLSAVKNYSNYYQLSPDKLTKQHIQDYFLHLVKDRHASPASCHLYLNGIRFLYVQVLLWPELDLKLNIPKRPQKIPELLTTQEVASLINTRKQIKHRQILSLCYGCGLRVSEIVAIKIRHIDGEKKLLRVEQGKGNKDRYIPLSSTLLHQLRIYWQQVRPKHWLFERMHGTKPLSVSTIQKVYQQAKHDVKIEKIGGIHSLRHAYATHQLSNGLPIHHLQRYLGHSDIKTTMRYVHWVPNYRDTGYQIDLIAQLESSDE